MAVRAAQHRAETVTVWTLLQIVRGEREIVGQFSTDTKGEQEARRLIAKKLGLPQINRLPDWLSKAGGKELLYRRPDTPAFWFRLEPWPLDGEGA